MTAERDERGRFLPGNPGGPGNPHARQVAQLRAALLEAVTPEDVREIIGVVVEAARGGDLAAAKLLFDRLLGPPVEADLIARIEELEDLLTTTAPARRAS